MYLRKMEDRKNEEKIGSRITYCSYEYVSACRCGDSGSSDAKSDAKTEDTKEDSDQVAADKVAKLIDDIYVQERTDKTDEQCKEAKEAWDALTDAQKELVEGENADPDYFGRDTGDASKDDPRKSGRDR